MAFGQANQGELQLRITDSTGAGLRATVHIVSLGSQYANTLTTDFRGALDAQHLPFGLYSVEIARKGFASLTRSVEIRSAIPVLQTIALSISASEQSVTVTAGETLLDRDQPGSVNQIGAAQIQDRVGSIPGRSIQDLVITQPGWLYEGNAVLHPRGSEYQTQFVVDGIPLTDDRSPSFGPEIEADDVQSISLYTAGIPAEYGRKMGGVVEINTQQDTEPGWHGQTSFYGGSFDSLGGFGKVQYGWGRNTLTASADGSRTDHYLNPVVTQNYSNTGTLGDFSAGYRRALTDNDKLSLSVRHEVSRYDIPNELLQQAAGQRQNADNIETMGIASYQHTYSANAMLQLSGMVRDNSNDFYSNPNSIPVYVAQHNSFRDGYFKGVFTYNRGHHEMKAGVESDNAFLHENTCYVITQDDDDDDDGARPAALHRYSRMARFHRRLHPNAAGSDPGLCVGAPTDDDGDDDNAPFSYVDQRPDLEQSAFAQDLIRLNNWTISAGLRYDHYQLIVNEGQLQPRFAISRYFPRANSVLHFSYDRIFQTPSFENILLSSSTQVESIDPTDFLRLPVKPSVGDYYEAGLSTVLKQHLKFDANWFRRVADNFADDDQIDSTTISFPIAFRKAIIYGLEGKIEIPEWRHLSGFGSYSYEVGNVWNPVTGGLFLGDDADAAAADLSGHFPNSQDQRNTVRGRVRYQIHPRLWAAFGMQYDTGLPFEFRCDPSLTLQECIQGEADQYGQDVVDRINFDRGRILPSFLVNASFGADLYTTDRAKIRLQVDGSNLNNVVDVIDFGGLFSGNAIGPSRSFNLRLTTAF
ncbi:MAG TPA: TonB-dependent receptor plug domain-containing protein [Acidobacteriaceae bacterium]|nr:TonB-dependent receptor plug domain-containing protein [Acidobacteriaceae bacterium]